MLPNVERKTEKKLLYSLLTEFSDFLTLASFVYAGSQFSKVEAHFGGRIANCVSIITIDFIDHFASLVCETQERTYKHTHRSTQANSPHPACFGYACCTRRVEYMKCFGGLYVHGPSRSSPTDQQFGFDDLVGPRHKVNGMC